MAVRSSLVASIAKRFLLSKSSDGFISFITWVSISGVTLGVLALIVVTSVINGFERELMRVITGLHSDIILYTRSSPVSDGDQMEKKILESFPEVKATTQTFNSLLMVGGPHGVVGGVLEGFDPPSVGLVTDLPRRMIEGTLPKAKGEFAVGAALAERLGLKVGSPIRLIAPFAGGKEKSDQAIADQAKSMDGTVVGLVKIGMHQYDSKFVFAPKAVVQDFFEQQGKITSIKMRLHDVSKSRDVAKRMTELIGPPMRAKDWSMLNQNLFVAIEMEKAVISLLLTAIILVAAFNMMSTLMMLMHDKIRELSILKAMGFGAHESVRLFAMIGTGIGLVGIVSGTGLGLFLNFILDRTRLISLPADIYYIDFLPVTFRWPEIAGIGVFALLICLLGVVYPAWKLARRSPLEGIRYE